MFGVILTEVGIQTNQFWQMQAVEDEERFDPSQFVPRSNACQCLDPDLRRDMTATLAISLFSGPAARLPCRRTYGSRRRCYLYNVATIFFTSSGDLSPASGVPGIRYFPISSPPTSTGS